MDNTERELSELERKKIGERYEGLFNMMSLGFCVIDMIYDEQGAPYDYRFTDLNPAFESHTGLRDAKGKTMRELAPDIEQFWFDTYGHVARTGEPVTFVNESPTMGRWFEVQAFRLGGGDQQVGILFTDITERKRAEKNSAQLAAIVTTSHDAIISKNLQGIIQTWNQGARTLFGYTAEEAIGNPTTMLMPPDRVNEEPGILARIGRGELIDSYETVRQHKDGTLLDLSLTISPIRDASGTIIGASKIGHDISERKRKDRNLAFLSTISHELLQLRTKKTLPDTIGRPIGIHMGLSGCAFMDVNDALNEAVITQHWHLEGARNIVGSYRMDEFISEALRAALRAGEAWVVEDTSTDARTSGSRFSALGIGSFLAVPVVQEGDWRFILCVYHAGPHAWRPDEVELVRDLSQTIWTRLERLHSETLLRQSEERLQSALEAAGLGTWNMDVETGLFQSDERFDAIFGKTVSGLNTEDAISDIHPEDHDMVLAAVAAAIRIDDPQPYAIQYRVIHADGSIHWVDIKGSARFEGTGPARKLTAFAGTVGDITERKAAQRAVLESEQRYTNLFNTMDQGFCVIQMEYDELDRPVDWIYLEMNPAFEKQSGLKHVAGKRASEILPGLEPHWYQTYDSALRGGQGLRYLNEVKELGRWLDVYAFPSGDPGSKQLGVLFTDVTERMRMENEMKHASQVLRENDKRKNEFLAMLAHELRNPLAPLRTGLEVIQEMGGQDSTLLEVGAMMQRQVRQMVRLVDDLLDVSRVSRGKITLRKERLDLSHVLKGAQETVQATMADLGQQLVVAFPDEPMPMLADPTRLTQVFANLLNNASKFSDEDGRIELRAHVDGDQVCVLVKDEGVGIAAEDLTRIFDLFSQVDSSLARNNTGLGIGLTLVRDLVQMHGGTVEAHSAGLGHGCTMTVRLPLFVDAASKPDPARPRDGHTTARSRKVLVVDDNQDAAELLTMALARKGHTVQVAFDGPEGLEMAESFSPDVVLLDIGLPGLNGYEVAKRIRQEPWGAEIYLVALTGWGQEEDQAKSSAAGFNIHLVKPVELEAIEKLLRELPVTRL